MSIDYEASRAEGFYTEEVYELFKELEFRNMLSRFDEEKKDDNSVISGTFRRMESLKAFLGKIEKIKDGRRAGRLLAAEGDVLLAAAASVGEET